MKKNKLFGLALVATMFGALFSSCNGEEKIAVQGSEIQLTSEITPSRVTSLNYQSTQIVEGQEVGVTIVGANSSHENVAWKAGVNGSLSNTCETLYWGKNDITITAYHPFNPNWTDAIQSFSVNVDQSVETNYLNSDLLWTTKTASKTANPVPLTFSHRLAKINVTLTSDDIDDLSNATISVCGTNVSTVFNWANGELSEASNPMDIVAGTTTSSVYTASCIIIPQTVASGTQFISVKHNGKTYHYTLNEDKVFTFGHSYSYTLNVKEAKVEVDVESDNITDWNDEEITGDMEEEVLEKRVDVQIAGTLDSLISEKEKYSIKTLIVSGDINGDDVRFIREMAGFDVSGNPTNGQVINLDLSNANIVVGGGPYLNQWASFDGFKYDEYNGIGHAVLEDKYTKESCTDYMFMGLKQLEVLQLPENLKYLGDRTFYGCHRLKEITIPKSVIYWDYSSHNYHFHSCLSLEAIYVEEGHEDLYSKNGCLYSRKGVDGNMSTLMVIPSAFTEFEIPSDINRIDSYAFLQGNSLQKLIIPKSAPELNPYYFDHFFFLENFVVDGSNDRYAAIDGVLYSKDLKTIECYPSGRLNSSYEIPDGVTSIGDGCFNTSWHLQEIIIPEGVDTIGESAFFTCHNLHEITLPSSVKYIGGSAFQHLHLYKLTCKAVNPPTLYDDFVFVGNYEKIYVPAESVELYKNADYWRNLADVIYPIEEDYETLSLPNGQTFKATIKTYLENDENIKRIKFVAESETTSTNILVTDDDGTIGYIVTNGDCLEIHTAANEFMANEDCSHMFDSYEDSTYWNIETIEFGVKFNTSNVKNMNAMFYEGRGFISLDVSHFDTSNVTDMCSMFGGCMTLVSLDVSNFNTTNVTNMAGMFVGCSKLISLDLSHFDTSNVTRMDAMFAACNTLTSLDLSNFDTSKVTDMRHMFVGCITLTSLDVDDFDTSNVTEMEYMFCNCYKLIELDLTNFSFANAPYVGNMFESLGKNTELITPIKVTEDGYKYFTETTSNCGIGNYAKFVKPDGTDWN